MNPMPTGEIADSRAGQFDYAAERLIRTHERILTAEPLATQLGEDMTTAWGLAFAVTHYARATLNAAAIEDWDLDSLDEDDCLRRTAIIHNGWMAGEAFLLASGIGLLLR
jgi:hypothetical protein